MRFYFIVSNRDKVKNQISFGVAIHSPNYTDFFLCCKLLMDELTEYYFDLTISLDNSCPE